MLHVRWKVRVLLILSLASALNQKASEASVCPLSPGVTGCWQARHPTLSLQSMTLSLISALVMGAQGASGWTPSSPTWQTSYTTACRNHSQAVREREGITNLKWLDKLESIEPAYQECNPEGAIRTIRAATGQTWLWKSFKFDETKSATNFLVAALRDFESPVVIPYNGRWEHWITVVEAKTYFKDVYRLTDVTFYDGLLGEDLSLERSKSTIAVPRVTVTGSVFNGEYMELLWANKADCNVDHNCDIAPGDPWYGKYILLYTLSTSLSSPTPTTTPSPSFTAKPEVVMPGQPMNSALASSRVWDAARRAGGSGPSLAAANTAVADPEVLVNGFWPSGAPWNYYLVALRDSQNQLSSIVQLAAADGAFESMVTLPQAIKYSPVSLQEARQTASQALKGDESLDAGVLTWDARVFVNGASSPSTPYYEFKIRGGDGTDSGSVVRVVRHTGACAGRQAPSARK